MIRGHYSEVITVTQGQVPDLRYDNIPVVILDLGYCRNKAGNIIVDARLETRPSKVVDHRLNFTRRHVARTGDPAEDKGEVYNVAHHEADLLLAKERVEAHCVNVVDEGRAHLFS